MTSNGPLGTFVTNQSLPIGINNYDLYGSITGTSMSAPHITGIIGLLRSANPLNIPSGPGVFPQSANLTSNALDPAMINNSWQ